jgi:hypothetical protein
MEEFCMISKKYLDLGYTPNVYRKLVVGDKEVYYGCILDINEEAGIAKIRVTPWRDKDAYEKQFQDIPVPLTKLHLPYNQEVEQ